MSAREDALLSHIISQLTNNVDFLVSHNYITPADGRNFLNKLPTAGAVEQHQPYSLVAPETLPPPTREHSPPTPPSAKVQQARALWAYNLNGEDPDDLSFNEGDTIDIVEETNPDWWMGRFNGKEALFPSSYVEKISSTNVTPATPALALEAPPSTNTTNGTASIKGGLTKRVPPQPQFRGNGTAGGASNKPVYRPFGAAHHGYPNHEGGPSPPLPAGANGSGLQNDVEGQEQKKKKFGKYGDTLAHSAVGGAGFGAGAAIGSGLVRAIF